MAEEMELVPLEQMKWSRHPLAFLVEAADDICYHIIDLEDGCRLGLMPFEQVKEMLAEIIGDSYSEEKMQKIKAQNERLGALRAMAIGQLIQECSEVFIANEEAMREGYFDTDLTDLIPSAPVMKKIMQLSIENIYHSKLVLEKEAGGYEVIDNLIEVFATVVYADQSDTSLPKHKTVLRLLPEEYEVQLNRANSVYELLQIVIDFVSGLTDSHAVRLYKTIKGYRLPV